MFSDLCHSWPHVTEEVSQLLGCDTFSVTCARLHLAHVTPSGVTSQNPHTLYNIHVNLNSIYVSLQTSKTSRNLQIGQKLAAGKVELVWLFFFLIGFNKWRVLGWNAEALLLVLGVESSQPFLASKAALPIFPTFSTNPHFSYIFYKSPFFLHFLQIPIFPTFSTNPHFS